MDDVIMRFNEQFIDDVIFLDFLAKRPRDSSGDADVAPENPASACKMHCLHMCICMNVLIICYFMLFCSWGSVEMKTHQKLCQGFASYYYI